MSVFTSWLRERLRRKVEDDPAPSKPSTKDIPLTLEMHEEYKKQGPYSDSLSLRPARIAKRVGVVLGHFGNWHGWAGGAGG